MGAYDFYQKPVDAQLLDLMVKRAYRVHELEKENRRLSVGENKMPLEGIIATSPAMLSVAPGASETLQVYISLDGLDLGLHAGAFELDAPGADGAPLLVPVNLEYVRFNSPPPVPALLSPDDGAEYRPCLQGSVHVAQWPEAGERFEHTELYPGFAKVAEEEGFGAVAMVYNAIGAPAGVVSITKVRLGEESDRKVTKDMADITAQAVEQGSTGLPVGVQVVAAAIVRRAATAAIRTSHPTTRVVAAVVIVGGGVLGSNAARSFLGLGAQVTVLDQDPRILQHLDETFPDRVTINNGRTTRYLVPESRAAAENSPYLPPPVWEDAPGFASEDELAEMIETLADLPPVPTQGIPWQAP